MARKSSFILWREGRSFKEVDFGQNLQTLRFDEGVKMHMFVPHNCFGHFGGFGESPPKRY